MLARRSNGDGLTKRLVWAYSQPLIPASSAAVTNSVRRTRKASAPTLASSVAPPLRLRTARPGLELSRLWMNQ